MAEGQEASAPDAEREDLTGNEPQAEEEESNNQSKEEESVDSKFTGQFFDLCDLLPPLPKKGNFDVQTIKKSQYFFS